MTVCIDALLWLRWRVQERVSSVTVSSLGFVDRTTTPTSWPSAVCGVAAPQGQEPHEIVNAGDMRMSLPAFLGDVGTYIPVQVCCHDAPWHLPSLARVPRRRQPAAKQRTC